MYGGLYMTLQRLCLHRFQTTPFPYLVDDLTRTLKEGDIEGVTKEYVVARDDMSR
jgi:hypothetical protein